jgi:hypothetical protein
LYYNRTAAPPYLPLFLWPFTMRPLYARSAAAARKRPQAHHLLRAALATSELRCTAWRKGSRAWSCDKG